METIKRGSVYLTDDYIQTMLSTDTVSMRISSFALIKLPKWSQGDGLYIDSSFLGYAGGITDPNYLLPRVFLQYWYNCMALCRQAHSAGRVRALNVEDMAEQAFWKTMIRLSETQHERDGIANGEWIQYESEEIAVSNSNVDGNAYLELLLTVPATALRQVHKMSTSIPAYLTDITNLPVELSNVILGGNEVALYDKEATTYKLIAAIEETSSSTYTDMLKHRMISETGDTEFEYNAVLLFYTVQDGESTVKQLAGIYFPNQWQQVSVDDGHTVYELPTIKKSEDISQSFSLNIMFSQFGNYQYHAGNSSLGESMLLYNDAYRKLLLANLQITQLTDIVKQQQQQINDLTNFIGENKYSTIINHVSKLEHRIRTTFGDSVSTNQLLELFTQAKRNQGLLNLEIFSADISKALTDRDIVVSHEIGAYHKNDIVPAGTSVSEILLKILNDKRPAEYVQPGLSMKYNGASVYGVNYGESTSGDLVIFIEDGDSGGHQILSLLQKINGRYSELPIDTDHISFEHVYDVVELILEVEFFDGLIKENSDGTECHAGRIVRGTKTVSVFIKPKFGVWLGGIDILEQLETLTPDDMQQYDSWDLPTSFASSYRYQVIAVPSNLQSPVNSQPTMVRELDDYTLYVYDNRKIDIDASKYDVSDRTATEITDGYAEFDTNAILINRAGNPVNVGIRSNTKWLIY